MLFFLTFYSSMNQRKKYHSHKLSSKNSYVMSYADENSALYHKNKLYCKVY